MCPENQINNCDNCLSNIITKILILQNQDTNIENFAGCEKPFLGPISNVLCYNTRPVMLYNCATGLNWSFPYTINDTTETSTVFRIESLDECCCTCRVLYLDATTDKYVGTKDFFTINLNCVGAIKCLTDTYIELC